jgi:hypothetical protein
VRDDFRIVTRDVVKSVDKLQTRRRIARRHRRISKLRQLVLGSTLKNFYSSLLTLTQTHQWPIL